MYSCRVHATIRARRALTKREKSGISTAFLIRRNPGHVPWRGKNCPPRHRISHDVPLFGFGFQAAHSRVIARLDRAIQYSGQLVSITRHHGVLDAPHEAGHDDQGMQLHVLAGGKRPERASSMSLARRGRREAGCEGRTRRLACEVNEARERKRTKANESFRISQYHTTSAGPWDRAIHKYSAGKVRGHASLIRPT